MATKKVLMVDDSALARMMLRKVIQNNFPDWTLLEAAGAQQSLELVQQEQPTLALLDYNMPEMNGLDLAIMLIEKIPTLSIYLVTANIQNATRQRAEAAGIGFVCKPVDAATLKPVFASVLS
ncbi:MAG: response regulator [Thermodesulfobacteriota bacterium]|nr:response regulator [Thermodesulfobacteriota bacterium]